MPSWVADPRTGGKLVIPAEQIEVLKKAALERQDSTRRKFMSDKGEGKIESTEPVPVDQPMKGDLLSWAMAYAPWESVGGRRKPSDSVPFGFLRQIARQSFIDRVIVDKRISQMKHFARFVDFPGDKVPGFRVVHRRYGDPMFVETPDIAARCMEVQARLSNVTPEIHNGFRDLVTGLVEDELVLDRKVCVIYRDMQGRPAQWHAIDGSTVKPRLQVLLPWMYANRVDNVALAAEIVSADGKVNPNKIDLTRAAYVQEVEGRFVAAWTAEQMTIDITNPSTRTNTYGYGTSLLEKSLEGTRVWVMAWNYNAEIFKTNYPEAILALLGDYDPQGLESFRRQVLGEVGEQRNWRLAVVPGGPPDQFSAEVIKLRDTPKEMLFGELLRMLIALKCAAYQMHPSEINFSADMGGQETIFAKGSTEKEVSRATEEGLHTMLDNWCDWITRAFVQQNYDDLKVIVDGLDRPDDSTLMELADSASKSIMLVDEARMKFFKMPPLEGGMGEYIDSPSFLAQQQMVMQAEAAEQQGDAYDDGDFGEDGDDQEGGKGDSPFGGKDAKGGKDAGGAGGKKPFGGKGKGDEQDSGSAEGSDSADAPGGQWNEQGPTGSVDRPKAKPKDKKKPAKPGQHHPEGAKADKKSYTNKEAHGKPSEHHMRTEEGPPSKSRDKGKDDEERDERGRPEGRREGGAKDDRKGGDSKPGSKERRVDEDRSEDGKEDRAQGERGDRGGDRSRSERGSGREEEGDKKAGARAEQGGQGDEGGGEGLDALVALIRKDPDLLKKIAALLDGDDDE